MRSEADSTCFDRLINLVAEDNAIEDTIYHLHRALNAGRIDLDKFLRVSTSLHLRVCTPLPANSWGSRVFPRYCFFLVTKGERK